MAASRQKLPTHASGQKCSEVFMCPHGVLKILEDVLNLIHFSKILHTIRVSNSFCQTGIFANLGLALHRSSGI